METKTLSDKILAWNNDSSEETIEVEDVKQFIKDLKDWLKLHQDTLITGGTVWNVIKDKAGKELTDES